MFEEIIKRLEEMKCCQDDALKDPLIYRRNEHFDMAIDIAKEVAAEHNNGWIKCSDRLPEFNEKVCVTLEDGEVSTCKFYGYGEEAQGYKEFPEGVWESHQFGVDVIAWQPLPEPYKED